jgi:hypothetical protein
MSTRRKRTPSSLRVHGVNWRWIHTRDGKRLAGVLERVNTQWRAIKIDLNTGRDKQVRIFTEELAALRFIYDTSNAEEVRS